MHHTHFPTINSTQIYLKENLSELLKNDPCVLVSAQEQTAGVGRGENKWDFHFHSLAMSFTLSPNEVPTMTPLEIALMTAIYFQKNYGITIKVKWPNDLMTTENKKCGGILTQYINPTTVIVGLGINIGHVTESSAPDHYKHGLAFLNDENLFLKSKKDLAEDMYSYFLSNRIKTENIQEQFPDYCAHFNKQIEIDDDQKKYTGKFCGIGKSGEAIVETNGEFKHFYSSSLKIL
jgi:biotin-[acetyl-CoA-carboxylase] ligase BirA-like protein